MSTALHMCHGGPSGYLVSSPRETSPNLPASRQAFPSFRSIRCKFRSPLALARARNNPSALTPPVHPFSRLFTTRDTLFHAFSQDRTRRKARISPFFTLFHAKIFFPKSNSFLRRVPAKPLPVHALSWTTPPLSTLCPPYDRGHNRAPFTLCPR